MPGELAERAHREHVRTVQALSTARMALLGRLPRDDLALSKLEVQKSVGRPGLALANAPPAQPFSLHNRSVLRLSDCEVVRDGLKVRPLLSVSDLDLDRAIGAAASQLPESAALVPGLPQAQAEALGQEGKHVEYGRLPAPIRTEQHRHRSELQLKVSQNSIVLDSQDVDACQGGSLDPAGPSWT